MKCTCPACGRTTAVEADVGDFPTRCLRCGALLRIPNKPAAHNPPSPQRRARREAPQSDGSDPMRIQNGALAGLLVSRSRRTDEENPRIIRASTAGRAPAEPPPRTRVLRPESLRELHRTRARQKALRKAALRGKHKTLGVLGKIGFVIAAGLGIAALILEARVLLNPATVRADVIKTAPAAPGR